MVITRDYSRLHASSIRTKTSLVQSQQFLMNENNSTTPPVNITNNIFSIPTNL